ncbi:MAG: BASS family bile acid:Na+ symporter, partial [Thermoproteota archaeon]
GISCAYYFPKLTLKIKKPFKYFGFICFVGFVAGAASMNKAVFAESVSKVFWIVLICNTSGLSFGYIVSRLFKLTHKDSIAVSFETGIQNTAFGLVLIFGFFGGLGGMAVVAAWYGIWHIITGLTLAIVFSRNETTLLPNTNSTVTT